MNSPKEQAELYRKAAETIEMCAKHGIEAYIKYYGDISPLLGWGFSGKFSYYEFPIAVIEGHLVWADTIVYNCFGQSFDGRHMKESVCYPLTLTPPKPQPLCEVEGKPVYKGDKLWFTGLGFNEPREIIANSICAGLLYVNDGGEIRLSLLSWTQPKPTVMVEISVERAKIIAGVVVADELVIACRTALDNLK